MNRHAVHASDIDPLSTDCPSRRLVDLVADKWSMLIIPTMRHGPVRNGELIRRLGGISQKMLTQTLRQLERNGLVLRHDHREVPPRVSYELTALGRSLGKILAELDGWVEDNIGEVEQARATFEAAEERKSSPRKARAWL